MEVVRYDLGKEAAVYIRSLLEGGKKLNKRLAVLLLEHIDLAQGQIYTYLPPGLSAEQVNDFEGGGVVPVPEDAPIVRTERGIIVPIYSTQEHLTQFVQHYLGSLRGAIALFGDWIYEGTPQQDEGIRFLTIGDNEVYMYLLETDTDLEVINRSISEIETVYPPIVGVLSRIAEPELFSWSVTRREGTVEELEHLVRQAQFLIVEAYDLEGYLIWERTPLSLSDEGDAR